MTPTVDMRDTDDEILDETPDGRAARAMEIALQAQAKRPKSPPDWVLAIQPKNPPTDGTNGMHRILGILQTPETDEEIIALLEELS